MADPSLDFLNLPEAGQPGSAITLEQIQRAIQNDVPPGSERIIPAPQPNITPAPTYAPGSSPSTNIGGGPTPDPNPQKGSPLKAVLGRFFYGFGQGALHSAGMPTDFDIQNAQARQQLERAQAQFYQAHAQDMNAQAQARSLALQPVQVPQHIADEFGLDAGTKVPAGQLHEMAHTFYSMRANGKMEDPETAFQRRTQWGQQMGLSPDELKSYALTGQLPKQGTDKPDTSAEQDEKFRQITARQTQKLPISPEEAAWAQAYKAQKTLTTTTKFSLEGPSKDTSRSDRSYQFNTEQLGKIAAPLEERMNRLGRLEDTVNQQTPQADALIAPELLTVMAGGQGSGLRMNEAEIARIVGGRTNWESLQASVNKWQLDPSKGLSVTPAQRQQIYSLLKVVRDKVTAKQNVIDQARQALINTDDVAEHRRIVANAHAQLSQIDQGNAAPTASGVSDFWSKVPGAVTK